MESIAGIENLKSLNIGNTDITDLEPLKNLPALTTIQANFSKINDLTSLSGMESLRFIYCDNTGIDGDKAQKFMAANPGCLVIYNTEKLKANNDQI